MPVTSCRECDLFHLCFTREIREDRRRQLDGVIRRQRPLERNHHLYHAGQPLRNVCVVRSGSVKTYRLSRGGDEIVSGFHLPGELIGLDAIADERHPGFAVALEDSRYCEIPFDAFDRIMGGSGQFSRVVLRRLSGEVAETRELLMVIGRMDARARVATFLVNLGRRLMRRNRDPERLRLSMDRRDIANYLGLTIETVSRTLSWMQKEGFVRVRGKLVHILDREALIAMTGSEGRDADYSAGSSSVGSISPLKNSALANRRSVPRQ